MADSKTHSVVCAGALLIAITAVSMASRITARWLHKTMGVDDVLIFLSWILSIGICSSVMLATRHGLGDHRDEVDDADYKKYLELQIASSITFSWGVATAKASFAVLYLRIFPEGGFRIVNKFLIVFLSMQAIEETCVVLFKCSPIRKSWDFTLEGSCLDLHPLWYSSFVFNLITDLALFLEPIPSTWRLQLPLTKRLGLIFMLSLGLLVTSISVIRIVYVTSIGHDDTCKYSNGYGRWTASNSIIDQLAEPLIWSMVEICSLIICSCIPSLRQVAAFIPGLSSALGLPSGGGSYSHSGLGNLSIPLKSWSHKEYIQSHKPKMRCQHRSNVFGTTSRVTAMEIDAISENDSQYEIFPHKSDQTGAITVTTEVQHRVEDGEENTKEFNEALMPHRDELRNITERPDLSNSSRKSGSDAELLKAHLGQLAITFHVIQRIQSFYTTNDDSNSERN
ncbi:hypothetical protein F4813DRAFT_391289 [Daldinia decipiens]|uniref:uncharacterized protein n=1 Tax=Daldinia decipiens TaxID=326647 RepID=UPI0020C2AF07|nr:uncharacterized protein F4813DRAFT_391289 [Daldinia decipiens]KAI1655714.1 hypothetical protein F4813DRAFT_391289 [Daldinia decipiens]